MNDFVNENVGLFYAKDKFENILLINEITEHNKDIELTCPICGTQVRPRAINSDKVSPHFYHVTATEHSAESVLHWWYKNQYLISGDKFAIVVDGKRIEYTCSQTFVEKEYDTSTGKYRPDVVVLTGDGKEIFFEYNYTNKKASDEYAEKWIELDRNVVELNINVLINKKDKIFKPIFFDGIVLCKSRSERYGTIDRHISEQKITDRMRIKYLNGFLRDVLRYNKKDIDIDDLSLIIDNMNENDKLYLPKLLKRLKCNSVLIDYSNYKLTKTIEILKDILYERGLCLDEYGWIVTSQYSQKWTKCRGARFDNTICIKRYHYLKEYDYNRCKYNDVSNGYDVFFIDYEIIKTAINSSIDNELVRVKNIKRDELNKHIYSQKSIVKDMIDCVISNSILDGYKISSQKMQNIEYPSIYMYTDVFNKLGKYKGTGRCNKVREIIIDECEVMNRGKINFLKTLELLEQRKEDITMYCNNLFNLDVTVEIPSNKGRTFNNTTLEVTYSNGIPIFDIDLYEMSGENNFICHEDLYEMAKEKIREMFDQFNTLENFIKNIRRHTCNNKIRKDTDDTDKDNIRISFMKSWKNINCSIEVCNSSFVLKYSDKKYIATLNNYYQASTLVGYICEKLY